jgi:hypothetical protein
MASGPSTHNKWLKIAAKLLLRENDLVHFVKAAEIGFDIKIGKRYDPIIPLFPVILQNDEPTILDIGANMGQFGGRLSRIFLNGCIYSFEPIHSNVIGLN